MPETSLSTADYIVPAASTSIHYGQLLAESIPAQQFAHMPHPGMNHPAFCLGHMVLSANAVLKMLGREDLVAEPEGWGDLFEQDVECVEQDGRYPEKDLIVQLYVASHEAAVQVLPTTPEEVFQRENPAEGRFKELAPTIGAAVNFLLVFHHSVHLGQVSAWRRAIGLGHVL